MENNELSPITKVKRRIDYLDIAKFFAILLVILGHTTGNSDNPYYRVILYTFHMPLFFILSGIVIKKNDGKYDLKHWLYFFKKNTLEIIVPYLIWGLIYSVFNYNKIPGLLYGSWEKLNEIETLTSLWFLPCLFTSRVIVELVLMLSSYIKKINTKIIAIIFSIIFFTAGFLIPHPGDIGVFFCADIALVCAGFMLLGFCIKDILKMIYTKKIWIYIIILFILIGLFTTGILVQKDTPHLVIIARANYGNIGLFLLNSLSGSLIVIMFSMIITKLFENHRNNIIYKFMIWVGCNTMGIFLIHKNFLQEICMKGIASWGISLPNFGYAILGSIFAFLFSVVVVFIIDRYVPQLFGKFNNKQTKDV